MATIIRRTEVDGIPVFWVDAGPRPVASMQVRVGRADEPFALTGATHIVEHLALHQAGEVPFPANGSVELVQTTFTAAGRADENATFIGALCDALSDLDLDRLPQELQVLRVEADGRGPNTLATLLTYRYGTVGFGAMSLTEHALHGGTGPDVGAWAGAWFTRGNAVAWMSAPPPANLRLRLPAGERRLPAARREIYPLPLPSWAPAPVGGVMLGAPLERTAAGAVACRVLRARLERRLRRELGLSYEVSLHYMPLDAAEAHASIFASCRAEQSAQVAEEVIRMTEELGRDGPTAGELAEDLDGFLRARADPDHVLSELDYAASNALLGRPPETGDKLEAEMRSLSAAEVSTAVSCLAARGLVLGGDRPVLAGRWQEYPMWSTDAVAGRRFDSVGKRYPWTRGTPSVVVGDDGLSMIQPDGHAVTVRYDACSGVIRSDQDVRWLVGEDGFQLRIRADEWRHGDRILAAIDRAVAPTAQVTLVD